VRALLTAILPALLAACSGSSTPCEDLADEMASCAEILQPAFVDSCERDPESAELAVAAACNTGKADDPNGSSGSGTLIGWLDEGDACEIDLACKGTLRCVPLDADGAQRECLQPGLAGALCDGDRDCFAGLLCLGDASSAIGECDVPAAATACEPGADSCGDDVCRPLGFSLEEFACVPPGRAGSYCDDAGDCALGLACEDASDVHAGLCHEPL